VRGYFHDGREEAVVDGRAAAAERAAGSGDQVVALPLLALTSSQKLGPGHGIHPFSVCLSLYVSALRLPKNWYKNFCTIGV
jgi:hypothetical protein